MRKHKYSFWALIFSRHNELLYRKLQRTTVYLAIYSSIVVGIEIFYSAAFEKLQLFNIGQFHLIFSFVISILIAFRVNVSFSRFWEARGYWGDLVNNSRNLALKFNTYVGLHENKIFLDCLSQLPNIFKLHLRNQLSQEYIDKLNLNLSVTTHIPLAIIAILYRIVNNYRDAGKISFEQFRALDQHLVNLINLIGGCEKIIKTPIPMPFKIFVRKSLLFYMVIFPFGWADKFGILVIPMIIVIVDVLLGLELVSEDMEEPFNIDGSAVGLHTNLNLDKIADGLTSEITDIANTKVKH